MKYRVGLSVDVSISTSVSSIMQAEYCRVPCGFRRDPGGIVHVGMRAISSISPVATTETEDGTMSPCRVKLTRERNSPSGVVCSVAGNIPSVTRPTTESSFVEYFHTVPYG